MVGVELVWAMVRGWQLTLVGVAVAPASGKSNTHLFHLITPYCCLKWKLSRIKQIDVKEMFLEIRKISLNK